MLLSFHKAILAGVPAPSPIDSIYELKNTSRMILVKEWDNFKSDVDRFIAEATEIEKRFKGTSGDATLEDLTNKFKSWQTGVINFMKSAFDEPNNDYAASLSHSQIPRYNIGRQLDTGQQIKNKLEDLASFRQTLEYSLRLLSISDAVVRPNEVDLEERKSYDTETVLSLILDKLYSLYDNHYHSVIHILKGNGIELSRYGEDRELVKELENMGYVEPLYTRTVSARLTLTGKRAVEQARKNSQPDYSKISSSQEDINQKIDQIIASQRAHGMGQEILFEELQLLKDLYSQLDKKTWGQVLKAKLIDLGLSQVINKETMQEIFNELTHDVLRIG